MGRKERIVRQRVLAQEALGKLRAITELFGAEDERQPDGGADFNAWERKIAEVEVWIFQESPIA